MYVCLFNYLLLEELWVVKGNDNNRDKINHTDLHTCRNILSYKYETRLVFTVSLSLPICCT